MTEHNDFGAGFVWGFALVAAAWATWAIARCQWVLSVF